MSFIEAVNDRYTGQGKALDDNNNDDSNNVTEGNIFNKI